jgi:hypothetical protein
MTDAERLALKPGDKVIVKSIGGGRRVEGVVVCTSPNKSDLWVKSTDAMPYSIGEVVEPIPKVRKKKKTVRTSSIRTISFGSGRRSAPVGRYDGQHSLSFGDAVKAIEDG